MNLYNDMTARYKQHLQQSGRYVCTLVGSILVNYSVQVGSIMSIYSIEVGRIM